MLKFFIPALLMLSHILSAQNTPTKQRIIYGVCTRDSLQTPPFDEWFTPGYTHYQPNAAVVSNLKQQNLGDISIKVFFGSWCGDSKRELPRFMKLLSTISFPDRKVQLIGLGATDSLYKQSPGGEEKDLGIFRVPTFIIYKNGKELNRINEFPAMTLEKDLLAIINNQSYIPNYRSFAKIQEWVKDGTLQDENTSAAGLAATVRPYVANEHELNSLGYLLLKQGKKKEALRMFQVNYLLYPQSANTASSLGEGHLENANYEKAISFLEYALELNKEPALVKSILPVLYKAKEMQDKK